MTTVATDEIQQTVESLRETAAAALQGGSPVEFEQVERQLSRLDTELREMQQGMWADDARAVIRRLEKGEPLGPTDRDVIRAFLISDAERYLAMENNYQDWVAELDRLLGEIAKRMTMVDRNSVADLRGLLKDAMRLVPSIRNYLEERDRIDRCRHALESLDYRSRELLARILKDDLERVDR